jgi:hypothetical protein
VHMVPMSDGQCRECHRHQAGVDPLPPSHPVQKSCQSCHAFAES